jgi:hypothetical protein
MSAPSEILKYLQALKWPAFAGAVVFALRSSIKRFLDNLRMDEGSAKIPGIGEVTWKKTMQEVAEKVESLPEPQEKELVDLRGAPSGYEQRQALSEAEPATEAVMQKLVEMRMGRASSWDLIERLVFSDPIGAVIAAW